MNTPYFRIGTIGMILIAIMAPIHWAIHILGWMYIFPTGFFAPIFLPLLITAIVLYVGFLLAGIGFFGYYRVYNLKWGLVGFLIPILFGWTLIIVELDGVVFWVLKETVLAFTPILWSIAVFLVTSHTDNKRRTQIAGALLLAAGLAYLPQIILDVYGADLVSYLIVISIGTALLCLAGFLNSVMFLTEKVS